MVGSQLSSHMCVQTQYDRVPFGEQRARLTNRLGCDANATGVLYTPYMCTAVFLRLCSMAQSMDTKLVYYTI